jgi:hypothetical protein
LKQEPPAELARGGGRGGPGSGGGRAGFNGASGAPASGSNPAAQQPGTPAATGLPAGQPEQRRRGAQGNDNAASRSAQGGGDGGEDRPSAGGGRGGGGRDGANLTPEQREERRKQMEARMASMSPEERERFQRMRQGGGRGGSQRGQSQDAGAGWSGRPQDARSPQSRPTGIAATNATTIDALFAPLPVVEGRGRLWLFVNKQLKPLNVRTGISDGTWTEILDGGEAAQVQPGTEVVTNIVTGLEPQARPGQQNPGGNPLMPQQPQRGNPRGGGGPGGGGRGR